MLRCRGTLALISIAAALAEPAAAATLWNESVNGDLSNVRTAPTNLALSMGSNTITGTTVSGDIDFFTITVPASASFGSLVLIQFTSADDLDFLAIQSGPIITSTTSPAAMLGYVHLSAALVGTDVLDDMALGDGALGFSPPLPAGTYAMWTQQLQTQMVSYSFDLVVTPVPEPTQATLLTAGLVVLAVARRRSARA
jgi:hypothetical protein